ELVPTSTGVRNKKMATSTKMELSAADHDFTKLSITPSVSLFAKIPDDPIQSFYAGQVYVSLKNTIFQASSALRHATEFYNSIKQYYFNANSLPEIIIAQIDPELDKSMTTMNQLQKKKSYQSFIKKDFQTLSFIPDPEPLENDFDTIYGQLTSERFRPSATNVVANEETNEKKSGQFINSKIQCIVLCEHCGKMRCVYSNANLTTAEEAKFQSAFDSLCYTCRSQLLPEDHELFSQLSVRLNLTCDSPIESTYFSWRLKKFDVCYWCGESKDLIEPSEMLKAEWKTIYPLCEFCKSSGKTWFKRAQKKFTPLNNSNNEEENNEGRKNKTSKK
ncbi:13504_t:CDS:2, partial [Racocetra fulgida]